MQNRTRVLAGVVIISGALIACKDSVDTGISRSETQLLATFTQSFDLGTGGALRQGADQAAERPPALPR
jgi:hypothetical protein